MRLGKKFRCYRIINVALPETRVSRGIESKETNNIDIGTVILAELLLFVFMFTGRKRLLDRWEGIVFLSLYAAYIIFLAVE
jgi:Ca2+/Na+ antiporter